MIDLLLKDGFIKVGGDFQAALARIKGLDGRKWNAQEKRWEAPSVTVAEAARRLTGYPLDVAGPAGSYHVTKYGNGYTADEWQADQQARAAEKQARSSFEQQYRALEQEATRRLDALGVTHAQQATLINGWSEFNNNVERGAIKFSSPEREREIRAFVTWYGDAWYALAQAEDDAAEAAAERIYAQYDME